VYLIKIDFGVSTFTSLLTNKSICLMKKICTRKAILLLCSFLITTAAFGQTLSKRYVFVLGGYPANLTQWQSGWVDLRVDDTNRVLYIWPDGTSLAATPAVGTGSLGQDSYTSFSVGTLGWWGCGYYVGPDANPGATIDMQDVTANWVFHFAIRTDCAQDITVTLYGSTSNPSDPNNTTLTQGKIVLNKTNLPLTKRDATQWVEYEIPMSQLMTNAVEATNNLKYLAPLKKQNYVAFSGGNDAGSFIAWDNVYIGKPDSTQNPDAIINPEFKKLELSLSGDYLNVFNNNSNERIDIFNISGVKILSSNVNCINISSLSAGVYIVKSGNLVNKFLKK
jgi:hypothetical protein